MGLTKDLVGARLTDARNSTIANVTFVLADRERKPRSGATEMREQDRHRFQPLLRLRRDEVPHGVGNDAAVDRAVLDVELLQFPCRIG